MATKAISDKPQATSTEDSKSKTKKTAAKVAETTTKKTATATVAIPVEVKEVLQTDKVETPKSSEAAVAPTPAAATTQATNSNQVEMSQTQNTDSTSSDNQRNNDSNRRNPISSNRGTSRNNGNRRTYRSNTARNNRGSNNNNNNNNSRDFGGVVDGRKIPDADMPTEVIEGFLDMKNDGNGIIRAKYSQSERDAYISGSQIRRFRLRPGDHLSGPARQPKENEQFWGLLKIDTVNGKAPDQLNNRVKFKNLTPVYPDKKLVLETEPEILTTRLIDLVAPVGHGQRGLIVSPPKAGKTTMLKDVATGIAANYKDDVHLMAVLIGERPEEVTDIRRHIEKLTDGKGEVAASNFDEHAQEQVRVSELALERAKRLVEMGKHVVILLDSITRLARAYNLAIPTSGRTLSGGFDPAALYPPKKFFGAARNFEEYDTPDGKKTGSLTILGTALVDTGSRMDELIYEEFKGTGNMELHLDRQLAERRIWPAVDVMRSGTRREDLLFDNQQYQSIIVLRRMIDMLDNKERSSVLIGRMKSTKSNKEFLATLKDG